MTIAEILSKELGQKLEYVENVIALIDEGNTIPFIARYRKEMHGAMDDTALRNLETRLTYLRNLQARRDEVKNSIENQGKLTEELAAAIDAALDGRCITPSELHQTADGCYFSYDTATALNGPDAEEVVTRCNTAIRQLGEALKRASHLFLTFGTAWIYRLGETGTVVANCQKQPQRLFRRERLTAEAIVERYTALIEGPLRGKQIILTVSPIRHLGDGLEGNSVSKATLRLAAELLAERFPEVHYFPAYELLIDDLRDYRFYADDLCHPSSQAIAYIRERFAEVAFSEQTRGTMKQVEKWLSVCAHRPHNPHSEEYRRLCRETIEAMQHAKFDFSAEIAHLEARL